MAQKTIAQYIAGIRGDLKLNNADTRLTDRHIYLKMFDTRALLLKQSNQWLMSSNDIFQTIYNIELQEVDVVEACGIHTPCKIKRTNIKLPTMLEDVEGPLIKRITSLDGYVSISLITPLAYIRKRNKSTFKYDKNLYGWVRNGYLYLPDIEWDSIMIEAYFEKDIDPNNCTVIDPCKNFQDHLFRIPERLASPMVTIVTEKLLQTYIQIPQDTKIDKNENNK